MYRIRFHGRGGQGMKTASRILGTAFFLEGFEVQDAPRYGAERRGAPIFAYVRANRQAIQERGVIHRPDLVIVADDSLVPVPGAGAVCLRRSDRKPGLSRCGFCSDRNHENPDAITRCRRVDVRREQSRRCRQHIGVDGSRAQPGLRTSMVGGCCARVCHTEHRLRGNRNDAPASALQCE